MAEKNMNAKISVEFEETANRQQLSSGDNLPTLFGKIKKIISDLSTSAFSGSYIDLSDRPTTATTDTDGLMSAEDKTKLDSADDTYALKSKYGNSTINVGRKEGTAVGSHSTAEGLDTIASGYYSHAEGQETTANGNNSCHSEGQRTTASGIGSHAEGVSTNKVTDLITDFSWQSTTNDEIINAWNTQQFSVAHGDASHVEGHNNLSLGHASHSEGRNTIAVGNQSHTSGYYTKALHDNEAAYGKYNESKDDTLFSIGDGTSDTNRHNAFEITTTGGKLHDKDIATTDLIPTSLPANGGNADTVANLALASKGNKGLAHIGGTVGAMDVGMRVDFYTAPNGNFSGEIARSYDKFHFYNSDKSIATLEANITGTVNGHTVKADVPVYAKFTDTTYDVATASANGLMSSSDKSKLDGIAAGANKTIVDSVLSATSTNPVQNKVINSALSGIHIIGTFSGNDNNVTVSGLSFTPSRVIYYPLKTGVTDFMVAQKKTNGFTAQMTNSGTTYEYIAFR